MKETQIYCDFFFSSKVQDSGDVITEGRIRVVFSIPCEPNLDALIQNQHVRITVILFNLELTCKMLEGYFWYLL